MQPSLISRECFNHKTPWKNPRVKCSTFSHDFDPQVWIRKLWTTKLNRLSCLWARDTNELRAMEVDPFIHIHTCFIMTRTNAVLTIFGAFLVVFLLGRISSGHCSHTPRSGFHYETYNIGISPYHTLWLRFEPQYVVMSRVSWSYDKIQTFLISRAIRGNTVLQ